MKCDFSTMEWYCCLLKGHKGGHQSFPLVIKKHFKSKKETKQSSVQDAEKR